MPKTREDSSEDSYEEDSVAVPVTAVSHERSHFSSFGDVRRGSASNAQESSGMILHFGCHPDFGPLLTDPS